MAPGGPSSKKGLKQNYYTLITLALHPLISSKFVSSLIHPVHSLSLI